MLNLRKLSIGLAILTGSLAGLGAFTFDYGEGLNSMGFHAPQETARVLAESIDYARQGQLAAKTRATAPATPRK